MLEVHYLRVMYHASRYWLWMYILMNSGIATTRQIWLSQRLAAELCGVCAGREIRVSLVNSWPGINGGPLDAQVGRIRNIGKTIVDRLLRQRGICGGMISRLVESRIEKSGIKKSRGRKGRGRENLRKRRR